MNFISKVFLVSSFLFLLFACVAPGDMLAEYRVRVKAPQNSNIRISFYLDGYGRDKKEVVREYNGHSLYQFDVAKNGTADFYQRFMEPFIYWLVPPVGDFFSNSDKMFLIIDFDKKGKLDEQCIIVVSEDRTTDKTLSTADRNLVEVKWVKKGFEREAFVEIKSLPDCF